MNSSLTPEAARRVWVRGRVQGVYFRASTAECAHRLGLLGFARNEPDGSVLVLAAGATASLEALVEWLQQGPPMARVTSVVVEIVDPATQEWPPGFLTR